MIREWFETNVFFCVRRCMYDASEPSKFPYLHVGYQ